MNTNIRWLAAYTADIFDDYLAEIKLPIVCSSPGVARCASGKRPLSAWRISDS